MCARARLWGVNSNKLIAEPATGYPTIRRLPLGYDFPAYRSQLPRRQSPLGSFANNSPPVPFPRQGSPPGSPSGCNPEGFLLYSKSQRGGGRKDDGKQGRLERPEPRTPAAPEKFLPAKPTRARAHRRANPCGHGSNQSLRSPFLSGKGREATRLLLIPPPSSSSPGCCSCRRRAWLRRGGGRPGRKRAGLCLAELAGHLLRQRTGVFH